METQGLLERIASLEEKVTSLEEKLSKFSSLLDKLVPPQVPKLERNLSKKKEERIQQLIRAQHPE
jgi:phage shock protein A